MINDFETIKELLEYAHDKYNRKEFIDNDPISIPHKFSTKQDIEIMGFFASILAWGQRKTIINKCSELVDLMDGAPYDFIKYHTSNDLKRFNFFKHRTFNLIDLHYFIRFLSHYYLENESLEDAFFRNMKTTDSSVENGLIGFQKLFFSLENAPMRTKKHISTPFNKSACKRINMYLRWMVRKDNRKVDFGIWQKIKPSQLVCPCDLHVDRVGRKLELISRKNTDWLTAIELTENLKKFDPKDPTKYDFALFGLGVESIL
jgi:uncharacterized protein (TIGR02757 family)